MPTGETIRKINVGGTEHDVVGSAEALWGSIQGSIGSQTDLIDALAEHVSYVDNGKLGAKNLLPNDALSGEYAGITYTVNDDGTISVSGSTGSTASSKRICEVSLIEGDQYIFSGGYNNKVRLNIYLKSAPSTEILVSNTEQLWEIPATGVYVIQIYISTNTSVTDGLIKPMMRLATDDDSTYRPYALTNKALTDKISQLGTASTKNVPISGNAGSDEVVLGNDTRLTNALTYEDNSILGAKNLLPLSDILIQGSGITWIINEDGTIKANGTANGSADSTLRIYIPSDLYGNYWFSGCPVGSGVGVDMFASDDTVGGRLKKWDGTTPSESDWGGTSQEIQIPSGHRCRVTCRITIGTTVNNIVFKPMVRLGTDVDDTFYPIAKTNRELTVDKCDNSVIAPIESGATASRAYAVGDHFIRDGAFCTAKTAIASGATFTLGTNYTAGSIADMLANASYITSGLTATNCTINAGGYCKFGNLVVINVRLTATAESGVSIAGFPTYSNKASAGILDYLSTIGGTAALAETVMGGNGTAQVYKVGSSTLTNQSMRFSFVYLSDS